MDWRADNGEFGNIFSFVLSNVEDEMIGWYLKYLEQKHHWWRDVEADLETKWSSGLPRTKFFKSFFIWNRIENSLVFQGLKITVKIPSKSLSKPVKSSQNSVCYFLVSWKNEIENFFFKKSRLAFLVSRFVA